MIYGITITALLIIACYGWWWQWIKAESNRDVIDCLIAADGDIDKAQVIHEASRDATRPHNTRG